MGSVDFIKSARKVSRGLIEELGQGAPAGLGFGSPVGPDHGTDEETGPGLWLKSFAARNHPGEPVRDGQGPGESCATTNRLEPSHKVLSQALRHGSGDGAEVLAGR